MAMMQKVSVRLPPTMIEFIDQLVEDGLGRTRSEVLRKLLQFEQNLTGPGGDKLAALLREFVDDPAVRLLWLFGKYTMFAPLNCDLAEYEQRIESMMQRMPERMAEQVREERRKIREQLLEVALRMVGQERQRVTAQGGGRGAS